MPVHMWFYVLTAHCAVMLSSLLQLHWFLSVSLSSLHSYK